MCWCMPIRHSHQCKCESRKSTQCSWKSVTYFTLSQIHIIFLFPCSFLASDIIHWFLYWVSLDSYLLFRFSLHCFRSPSLFFLFFFLFFSMPSVYLGIYWFPLENISAYLKDISLDQKTLAIFPSPCFLAWFCLRVWNSVPT